jgi:hypothetical protein
VPIFVQESHAAFAAQVYFKDPAGADDIRSICTNLTAPNLKDLCPLFQKKDCVGDNCIDASLCVPLAQRRFQGLPWEYVVERFTSTNGMCTIRPGYARHATCFYWFEINYAPGTEPPVPVGNYLKDINIDWNYETASEVFNSTTNETETTLYNNSICRRSDWTERLGVTIGVGSTGTPCKLQLAYDIEYNDIEQLLVHFGLDFTLVLLLVVVVFSCSRGKYGSAYQEMFVRHAFSPPAQGTKLLVSAVSSV